MPGEPEGHGAGRADTGGGAFALVDGPADERVLRVRGCREIERAGEGVAQGVGLIEGVRGGPEGPSAVEREDQGQHGGKPKGDRDSQPRVQRTGEEAGKSENDECCDGRDQAPAGDPVQGLGDECSASGPACGLAGLWAGQIHGASYGIRSGTGGCAIDTLIGMTNGGGQTGEQVRAVLADLLAGERLDEQRSEALFDAMLRGQLDEAQIAGVLSLMQVRGVALPELVGAARVMRAHVVPVPVAPGGAPVVDTCGTGGAPKTFNVSTAAAIVASGAAPGRIRVAKHGNRSRTGRGSAEVLAQLGVDIEAPVEVQARCLEEVGVCFCFAIRHHPAARHAAGVRKSLGFPTIFNLLGPLTNPARATRQVMGIYSGELQDLMGRALAALGSERAMVVHSDDGLDEISVSAPTRIVHVREGQIASEMIEPEDFGLRTWSIEQVRASSVEESAQMIRDVLDGRPGAPRDFAVLNAGAALAVAGVARGLDEGVRLAIDAIEGGAARQTLERLVRVSRGG